MSFQFYRVETNYGLSYTQTSKIFLHNNFNEQALPLIMQNIESLSICFEADFLNQNEAAYHLRSAPSTVGKTIKTIHELYSFSRQ